MAEVPTFWATDDDFLKRFPSISWVNTAALTGTRKSDFNDYEKSHPFDVETPTISPPDPDAKGKKPRVVKGDER